MSTQLQIVDVRTTTGDSAFLLYNDSVSILYDTGFGFNGDALADRIADVLGDRQLDYILLTHSHYDHCLGAPYVTRRYPNAQVVAGEYTAYVFTRPSAIATMKKLDRACARQYKKYKYEFLGEELKVDIVLKDGESIRVGDKTFVAVNTPGHTKCCVAFYEAQERLLLSTETLGIYSREGVMPIILVSFEKALASMDKMLSLDLNKILIPHLGVIEGEELKDYLNRAKSDCIAIRDYILNCLNSGMRKSKIVKSFSREFLSGYIGETYPPKAAKLNTSLMVDLVEREYLAHK